MALPPKNKPKLNPKFKTDQLPKVWEANFPRSGKQLSKVTSQGLGSNFPRSLPKVWEANSQVSHFSIKIIFLCTSQGRFPRSGKPTPQGLGSQLPKVWEAVHY